MCGRHSTFCFMVKPAYMYFPCKSQNSLRAELFHSRLNFRLCVEPHKRPGKGLPSWRPPLHRVRETGKPGPGPRVPTPPAAGRARADVSGPRPPGTGLPPHAARPRRSLRLSAGATAAEEGPRPGQSSPHALPRCREPSPWPPRAAPRTLSLQSSAMSLPKAQGHPATRKQSRHQAEPRGRERGNGTRDATRKAGRRAHAPARPSGSRGQRARWRSCVRPRKLSCSAWWPPSSRKRSSPRRCGVAAGRQEEGRYGPGHQAFCSAGAGKTGRASGAPHVGGAAGSPGESRVVARLPRATGRAQVPGSPDSAGKRRWKAEGKVRRREAPAAVVPQTPGLLPLCRPGRGRLGGAPPGRVGFAVARSLPGV